MATATKKPTGITITRDGSLKFIVSWKVADSNYSDGQQVRIRAMKNNKKTTAWQTADVSTAKKSFSFTVANYNPGTVSRTIKYIEAEVRGKCKKTGTTYDWSAWSSKKLTLSAPAAPSVSAALTSANETTFTWSTSTKTSDAKPFVQTQWQTMLVKGCNTTKGKDLKWKTSQTGWQSGTGSANGTKAVAESSVAGASYTRWFRIRSRGAGGNSDWKYSRHVYAVPNVPTIKSAKATVKNNVTTITVTWDAKADVAHPIDQATLQYAFVTPLADLACPTGDIWTDGTTVEDVKANNTAQVIVNDVVGEDQCLFVRVVAEHDSVGQPSNPYLVAKGELKAPDITNVVVNSTDHLITVTADNNSDVPDSFLVVWFKATQNSDPNKPPLELMKLGIIPHGSTGTTPSAIQCPDWGDADISVGVSAVQGSYSKKTSANGVDVYTVNANMQSVIVFRSGDVPQIPKNVTADAATDAVGEVIVTWDWSWNDANQAEISWSDNPNAWESTEDPNIYVLDRAYQSMRRVVGLETGKTWYFAVRLMYVREDGGITYGEYSDIKSVNLSTAPNVPILALSSGVMATGGLLTATWQYITTDGTYQAYAEIYEATADGTPQTLIASAQTAQHVDIDTSIWQSDSTHYLVCRVTSASGMESGWSAPVSVYIAEPLTCEIETESLSDITVPDGDGGTRTVTALTNMPFVLTVTGAGAGGQTTVIIERAEEYHIVRPDDSVRDGYEGETIALFRQIGEDEITIETADLIGSLDDGAPYNLIATVEDGYGQSDTQVIPFEVYWTNQAVEPTAAVEIEDGVAVITPTAGEDTPVGSTCDIYRLSVDKPQLIIQGGEFGIDYVDPYPALGGNAGYRVVCVTPNGDYIANTTDGEKPAWVDVVGNFIDNANGIIDFNGEQIEVRFNVKLSTSWRKDFKETKYLGGTIRGDWNPAVSRTTTVSVSMATNDAENMAKMRELSEYNGLCHVRTQDGSSYTADIQVTNGTGYDSAGKNAEYTLNITRIAPEALDGMPYSEWVVS